MSFNTGLLGLRAAQMDLSVTGNNVANASTKGFKQSRAEFGDMYTSSILGSGKNKPGSGVLVERISQQHSQGSTDHTDRPLDMMIDGNGYFMMSNNGQIEYTRAGYFDLDKEGYVINNTGKRLQGYNADDEGSIIAGAPQDIQLSQDSLAPKATTQIDVAFNFDSRKPSLEIANFNPNDRTTYTEANRSSVFDSLGKEHELTQYFIKVPSSDENGEGDEGVNGNTWAVVTAFDGQFIGAEGEEPLTAKNWGTAGNLDIEGMTQATMVFNTQGRLTGYNAGYSTAINEEGLPANGVNAGEGEEGEAQASPLSFTITLPPAPPTEGNAGNIDGAFVGGFNGQNAGNNEITYNLAGTTQYGAGYSAQSQYQNGYTAGNLAGLEVSSDGTIIGRYSNGLMRDIGQVPVITFRNPEGLKPNGSTSWVATSESGDALVNTADLGITGSIIGGALEESNVDLAEELVKMIIGQRNYQANAKTIQTQDTITQTIINMR